MRLTGLPLSEVVSWNRVEADLWARAGAKSLAEVAKLAPDQTEALLAQLLGGA